MKISPIKVNPVKWADKMVHLQKRIDLYVEQLRWLVTWRTYKGPSSPSRTFFSVEDEEEANRIAKKIATALFMMELRRECLKKVCKK